MFKHPNFTRIRKYARPLAKGVLVYLIMLVGVVTAFNFLQEPNSWWSPLNALTSVIVFYPAVDYWLEVINRWFGE